MLAWRKLHLVTYGNGWHYEASLFQSVQNRDFVKPAGGLWASPVNSSYGWKDWCQAENFGDLTSYFTFWLTGQVLVIDHAEDMLSLPWRAPYPAMSSLTFLDYEKIAAEGAAAIHLTVRGQQETRFTFPKNLYGWDCECVLVLNKDCIRNV